MKTAFLNYRKNYVNSLEQNSALMKLSSRCFESVVT